MTPASSLKDRLANWHDWDGAGYEVDPALGILNEQEHPWPKPKEVFWSNNPLGNAIHDVLERLVDGRVLEKRTEPDLQYRWRRVNLLERLAAAADGNLSA